MDADGQEVKPGDRIGDEKQFIYIRPSTRCTWRGQTLILVGFADDSEDRRRTLKLTPEGFGLTLTEEREEVMV